MPRLPDIDAGLVTVWNENGAALQFWRSVFERKTPNSLGRIETHIAPIPVGQGNNVRDFDDELLDPLTAAHAEAAGGALT